MAKRGRSIVFVPVTPAGTPLIELKGFTKQQAINNLLRFAAHMPYGDWPGFERRGYKIESWVGWQGV